MRALMELLPDRTCLLCEQNTAVLSSQCVSTYMKDITKTFFDTNKQGLTEFQQITATESLCVICTHKVYLSHKFKDDYEETIKKQSSYKKNREAVCFICEEKAVDLIQTDDNPNDFNRKIRIFMSSTSYNRPYVECVACFTCLFHLNMWFEVYSGLLKKFDMEDVLTKLLEEPSNKALRKIQSDDSNHTPIAKMNGFKKDKENVTPPSENELNSPNRIQKEIKSSTRKRVSLKMNSESNLNKKKLTNGTSIQSVTDSCLFINNELKHLKTVLQFNSCFKYPTDVLNDKKMFREIPYVLITRNDKQMNLGKNVSSASTVTNKNRKSPKVINQNGEVRRSGRAKKEDVIELSDDDDKQNEGNLEESVNQSNEVVKKDRELNGTSSILHRKTPLKIRLSKKFVFDLTPKSKNRPSNISKKTKHVCKVCDKVFSGYCNYKQHVLWHEKPEIPKVNIIKRRLPAYTKVSEFIRNSGNAQNKIKNAKINKIVQKYMGESTELFDDTEFNQSKEIQDIIVNLDSPGSNDKLKDADLKETETSNTQQDEITSDIAEPSVNELEAKDGDANDAVEENDRQKESNDTVEENDSQEESNDTVEENDSQEESNDTVEENDRQEESNDRQEESNDVEKSGIDTESVTKNQTESEQCTAEEEVNTVNNSDDEKDEKISETNVRNEPESNKITESPSKTESKNSEQQDSDSDRTFIIGEQEEKVEEQVENTAKDDSYEDDILLIDNDEENDIEKVLAKLHGESDGEEFEKDSDDAVENISEASEVNEQENDDEICEVVDDKDTEDSIPDEIDNDDSEVSSNKRKRIDSSDDEFLEKGSSDFDLTPRTKKVRFAMDYRSSKTGDDAVETELDEQANTSNTTDLDEENALQLSDTNDE